MPRKFANSNVQLGALWRKIIIGQLNRFRAGVVIKSMADLVYSWIVDALFSDRQVALMTHYFCFPNTSEDFTSLHIPSIDYCTMPVH